MPATVVARTSGDLYLSGRDRRIITLALTKTSGARVDFSEALRALREAAEEVIPGGRIFFLGSGDHGPIVGSILSGVGIVQSQYGIELVRARPNGDHVPMGWFSR